MKIKFIKVRNRKNEIFTRKYKRITNLKMTFVLLCFLFLVGIIFGTIYAKKSDFLYNTDIDFINAQNCNISKTEIFYKALCQNVICVLFFWVTGLSALGVPIVLLMLFFEGASIGVTISYLLSIFGLARGYEFIYIVLYITTLINVFSIIRLCISSIELTDNLVRKNKDIKSEFVRHSSVCTVIMGAMIFSSYLEMYLGEIGKNILK